MENIFNPITNMNIAIIGAGPAGIYASLLLAQDQTKTITLFDQNSDIGQKLKLTGGGRMNVTNKEFTDKQFSSSSKNLLKKLFKNPHIKNREAILETLGIEYQWEKNRAILKSQDAVAEVARLKSEIQKNQNVTMKLGVKVSEILPQDNGFLVEGQNFDKVIISSGGMFRIKDNGPIEKTYELPLALNHTITAVTPSLSPILFKDSKLRELAGLSFEGELKDLTSKQKTHGDILITHSGISGPAVLDFSGVIEGNEITIKFTSNLTEEEFNESMTKLRTGSYRLRTYLRNFLPNRMVDAFMLQSELEVESIIADIPKKKLQTLRTLIFNYPVKNFRLQDYPGCWTTKGGVNLSEVNTATLESKTYPGLYFAGEVLDVNGLCGGFNISFAAISAQIITDHLRSL